MTKFLNISTDTTLGGSSPADDVVSSQKAIKSYVDSQTGQAPAFANITGSPDDNTALKNALDNKVTKTTGNYQLYGTNGSGVTTSYTFSSGNTASTIVYRTADSQIRVAQTPTGSTDATSKKYVDDGLSAKQDALSAGTGISITSNTVSTDRTKVSFVDWSD